MPGWAHPIFAIRWIGSHPSNSVSLGWFPKEVPGELFVSASNQTRLARRTTLPPTSISAASYIHESNKQFHNEWELRAYQLHYLGTSIKPRCKSADCYIKACEDDNALFARFTRMVTNHAPIGSYYRRFPHLQKSEFCLSPGWRFESRDHVLDKCSRYSRHWESWPTMASREPSSLHAMVGFLLNNPRAFNFGPRNTCP